MSKATQESVQAVFSPDSLRDEVAHLNSLLTDSYAATSALFQLLRDHNIPIGSTELIKAREKVEAEMQTLRTANAGLVEKVKRLEEAGKELGKASRTFLLTHVDDDDGNEDAISIDQVNPESAVQWEDPPSAGEHIRLRNAINDWNRAKSQP